MKFKVQVKGFLEGVLASFEVATRGVVKDFYGTDKINIDCKNDKIILSSFGGRVGLYNSLDNKNNSFLNFIFEAEGSATVSAKDLVGVLQSFHSNETLCIELRSSSGSKEVYFSMESDAEQYQTLPCYDRKIALPQKTDDFSKVVTIHKDLLLKGMKKVLYAIGFEKDRREFMIWYMTIWKNKVRFSSGSGARHAMYEVEGDSVVSSDPVETKIIIPKEYITILSKSLSLTNTDVIIIKESKRKDTLPFHTVLECDSQEFILSGIDPSLKTPDEEKMFSLDYPIKMTVRIGDISPAVMGMAATFNDQVRNDNKSHKIEWDIDLNKKEIKFKANEYMKSVRKTPIQEVLVTNGVDKINLSSISLYLSEIVKGENENEYIQIEVIEPKKPVIIYKYASNKVMNGSALKNVDKVNNYSERFITCFGTYGT